MDIGNVTLAGLAAVGVVNVVGFFLPLIDPRVKFALSFVAAFLIIALVPVQVQDQLLGWAKEALVIAFGMSGVYKLSQKIGGDR